MDSNYQNFVVMDVETGGLPGKEKKAFHNIALTEVAAVVVNSDLEIVLKESWLIKPYKDDLIYDKGAEIASGISKQMCIDEGITIEQCYAPLKDIFKKYKTNGKPPTLVGHNFNFDIEFLVGLFEFHKDDISKYVNDDLQDTLRLSRLCWTESANYKLGTCCSNAGVTLKDAHRALTDTISTAELFIYFMRNLRGLNKTSNEQPEERFRDRFEL